MNQSSLHQNTLISTEELIQLHSENAFHVIIIPEKLELFQISSIFVEADQMFDIDKFQELQITRQDFRIISNGDVLIDKLLSLSLDLDLQSCTSAALKEAQSWWICQIATGIVFAKPAIDSSRQSIASQRINEAIRRVNESLRLKS